jgi:hypothetical protein
MPVQPKAQRIDVARRKRNSGITLFIIGGALTVIGVALTADGVTTPHPLSSSDCHYTTNAANCTGNVIELTFGIIFDITGPVFLGVGAGNWGKYQGQMNRIAKEPDMPVPGQPGAFLFRSPTFRF